LSHKSQQNKDSSLRGVQGMTCFGQKDMRIILEDIPWLNPFFKLAYKVYDVLEEVCLLLLT